LIFNGNFPLCTKVLRQAISKGVIKRDSRWNFVVEDFQGANFASGGVEGVDVNVATLSDATCCNLTKQSIGEKSMASSGKAPFPLLGSDPSTCLSRCPAGQKPKHFTARLAAEAVGAALTGKANVARTCGTATATDTADKDAFATSLTSSASGNSLTYDSGNMMLSADVEMQFKLANKTTKQMDDVATWSATNGVAFSEAFMDVKIPRFFRVGMSPSVPWLYEKKDAEGAVQQTGAKMFEGYCMDLLVKIAEKLNFEFEVVVTEETRPGYTYGRRNETDGSWSGMIGDLVAGNIDLIVADLTMTSEREEVIDFVSPYFDQAGISIVLRRKVREQSLFKFLSVLKTEVWLGIVAAVIVTAVLIWLLDRYSPYSARCVIGCSSFIHYAGHIAFICSTGITAPPTLIHAAISP